MTTWINLRHKSWRYESCLHKAQEQVRPADGGRSRKSGYLWSGGRVVGRRPKGASGMLEMFFILIWVLVSQIHSFIKINWAAHLIFACLLSHVRPQYKSEKQKQETGCGPGFPLRTLQEGAEGLESHLDSPVSQSGDTNSSPNNLPWVNTPASLQTASTTPWLLDLSLPYPSSPLHEQRWVTNKGSYGQFLWAGITITS